MNSWVLTASICVFLTGGDDCGRGEHFLLLPVGHSVLPPVGGEAGVLRISGRGPHTGGCEETPTGCVWKHGAQLPQLQHSSVLRR